MLKRVLHFTSIVVILSVILSISGCFGTMGSHGNMDGMMTGHDNTTHHYSGNSDANKSDNSEK
ncbi:MAG: hypothetical protein HQK93_09120 [Nitrospirae bacterium]|nr:hypothetical protein [Nitrospirota bacterium]